MWGCKTVESILKNQNTFTECQKTKRIKVTFCKKKISIQYQADK